MDCRWHRTPGRTHPGRRALCRASAGHQRIRSAGRRANRHLVDAAHPACRRPLHRPHSRTAAIGPEARTRAARCHPRRLPAGRADAQERPQPRPAATRAGGNTRRCLPALPAGQGPRNLPGVSAGRALLRPRARTGTSRRQLPPRPGVAHVVFAQTVAPVRGGLSVCRDRDAQLAAITGFLFRAGRSAAGLGHGKPRTGRAATVTHG